MVDGHLIVLMLNLSHCESFHVAQILLVFLKYAVCVAAVPRALLDRPNLNTLEHLCLALIINCKDKSKVT